MNTITAAAVPWVPRAEKPPSGQVHIAAFIDATERVIEPVSTQSIKELESIKQAAGGRVSADVMIDRTSQDPLGKMLEGAVVLGMTKYAPLGVGLLVPWLASPGHLAAGVALGAATAYLTYRGLQSLKSCDPGMRSEMREARDLITSGCRALCMGEPRWNGRRTYQIQASHSRRLDSTLTSTAPVPNLRSPQDIATFLADSMRAYRSATNVLLMSGHGNTYRSSSGLPFATYQRLLSDVAQRNGQPTDLLLLSSCKMGNLEALAATSASDVRYAVVSEENLYAVNLLGVLQSALQDPAEATPRQLGERLIAHADKKEPAVRTLALVDMSRIPALTAAVDTLGNLLADEAADGRLQALRDVIAGTQSYPAREDDNVRHPSAGDLKIFTQRLQTAYSGRPLQTPRFAWSLRRIVMGDHKKKMFENSYPEAAASPRAAAIAQASAAVLAALSDTVVASHQEDGYKSAGGLSIQLPHPDMGSSKVYQNSAAPDGWKRFVGYMARRL